MLLLSGFAYNIVGGIIIIAKADDDVDDDVGGGVTVVVVVSDSVKLNMETNHIKFSDGVGYACLLALLWG